MSEIILIAEHLQGKLRPASLDLAAFAQRLARHTEASIKYYLLGRSPEGLAQSLARDTGRDVLALKSPELEPYNAEAYKSVLVPLIREQRPDFVLLPHSSFGWDLGPRLAVAAGGSSISGAVSFQARGNEAAFTRQMMGGRVHKLVKALKYPCVVTVAAGAAGETKARQPARVTIQEVKADLNGTETLEIIPAPGRKLDLSKAEVIVAAGRGVGGPEGLGAIRDLAACFDRAMVGASRPVVDYGWLPMEHQVGQTGQTVSPKIYIACGISGAMQHVTGMSRSQCIVAINTDKNAAIFNTAHYGVVCDLHELVSLLVQKITEHGR